jgi:hypothetical protein
VQELGVVIRDRLAQMIVVVLTVLTVEVETVLLVINQFVLVWVKWQVRFHEVVQAKECQVAVFAGRVIQETS